MKMMTTLIVMIKNKCFQINFQKVSVYENTYTDHENNGNVSDHDENIGKDGYNSLNADNSYNTGRWQKYKLQ